MRTKHAFQISKSMMFHMFVYNSFWCFGIVTLLWCSNTITEIIFHIFTLVIQKPNMLIGIFAANNDVSRFSSLKTQWVKEMDGESICVSPPSAHRNKTTSTIFFLNHFVNSLFGSFIQDPRDELENRVRMLYFAKYGKLRMNKVNMWKIISIMVFEHHNKVTITKQQNEL